MFKFDFEVIDVGSVFVLNYFLYGVWSELVVLKVFEVFDFLGNFDVLLGFYFYIFFCCKCCKFCYFCVFIDKNSEQIQGYFDVFGVEVEVYGWCKIVEG